MPGEAGRLQALASYRVLDTPPEPAFDGLVRAAALVAGVPTALIGLIDEHRQWYKARTGIDATAVARGDAFCEHVVRTDDEVVVADTTLDPRFATDPHVTAPGGVRTYAAFPLRVADGHVLGTLCVVGPEPRRLGDDQLVVLRTLAAQVVSELELRRTLAERERQETFLTVLLETVDVGVVACDPDGHLTHMNPAARAMHGIDADPTLEAEEWAATYDLCEEDGSTLLTTERVPLVQVLRQGDVRGRYIAIRRPGVPLRVVRCDGRRILGADGTVIGAVVAMADVTAQRAAAHELHELAVTDPLTGALNRRGLGERADPIIAAAVEGGRSIAVAIIDFDHFKDVNDRLGHAGGDALLRRSVEAWTERLHRDDLVARLGGEEFALVLFDCWPAAALGVVDLLRSSTPAHATASAGVAFVRPGDDLARVLERADRALYRAKRAGRDRTIVAGGPADDPPP